MRTRIQIGLAGALGGGLFLFAGATALAGAHTWDFTEAFRNADGTVWFIEMIEPTPLGMGNEPNVGGLPIASLAAPADNFPICIHSEDPPVSCNLTVFGSTGQRRMLFGTAGYAELAAAQGAPAPDQIVAINSFFNTVGDTLRYNTGSPTYDTWAIPGTVPTDGINSMNRAGGSLPNTPRNYLGATGSVNAGTLPPPVVPDGTGVGVEMTVAKLPGTSLRINYDVASCVLNNNHNIIWGEIFDLPASPGGTFTLSGGVCGIGATTPYTWVGPPDATDPSGLIWWLIVVSNSPTIEGGWGDDSADNERVGPGAGGSSLQCGVTSKSLINLCGS